MLYSNSMNRTPDKASHLRFIKPIVLFSFLLAAYSFAQQWDPPQQLTSNDVEDCLCYNAPKICANGDTVHLLWRNYQRIHYYRRSIDGGSNWQSEVKIDSGDAGTIGSIACQDDTVHIITMDGALIKYFRSTDGGTSWLPPVILGSLASTLRYSCAIAAESALVYTCWSASWLDSSVLFFRRSLDIGVTWEPETCLTNTEDYYLRDCNLSAEKNFVHLFHRFRLDDSLRYLRSTDYGLTWSTDTLGNGDNPYGAASKDKVHLTYVIKTYTDSLLYRRSTDNGITWEPQQTLLTYPSILESAIHASGDTVCLIGSAAAVNHYFLSTNGGQNWSSPVAIGSSRRPHLFLAKQKVHAVYALVLATTEPELIYHRGTFSTGLGERAEYTGLAKISLAQIYPDPFSTRSNISYYVPVACHISIKIYDVYGQPVRNLIDKEHEPKYYSIIWDGTNNAGQKLPSGVYFIQLRNENYLVTKKCLYLK